MERIEERYYYIFNFHYRYDFSIFIGIVRIESSRVEQGRENGRIAAVDSKVETLRLLRVEIEIGLFKYAEPMKFAIIIIGTIYE